MIGLVGKALLYTLTACALLATAATIKHGPPKGEAAAIRPAVVDSTLKK